MQPIASTTITFSPQVSKREMANVSGSRLSAEAINKVFEVNDADGDGFLVSTIARLDCTSLLLADFLILLQDTKEMERMMSKSAKGPKRNGRGGGAKSQGGNQGMSS